MLGWAGAGVRELLGPPSLRRGKTWGVRQLLVQSRSRLISQMLLFIAVEFNWRKFGLVAKVCLLLEVNFLLSGAPLSAGRFAGRKCVSYLFLHSEGNELD